MTSQASVKILKPLQTLTFVRNECRGVTTRFSSSCLGYSDHHFTSSCMWDHVQAFGTDILAQAIT